MIKDIRKLEILRDLRKEFYKLLTVDSDSSDRRKKGYNQAIFMEETGNACFNGTDLEMIMDKMDCAIRNIRR